MNEELVIRGLIVSSQLDNEEKTNILAYFDSLIEDSNWLNCLEAAGVDNWSGIDEAYNIRDEEDE